MHQSQRQNQLKKLLLTNVVWEYICAFFMLLSALSSLRTADSVVVWQLVQQRAAHNGCLYLSKSESWQYNLNLIKDIHLMDGIEKEIIEERGRNIVMKNVMRNKKSEITDRGIIAGTFVTVHDFLSGRKSSGRIIMRTNKLLIISWKAGYIDVYRNNMLSDDSVSTVVMNNAIIKSGLLLGKKIKYCR